MLFCYGFYKAKIFITLSAPDKDAFSFSQSENPARIPGDAGSTVTLQVQYSGTADGMIIPLVIGKSCDLEYSFETVMHTAYKAGMQISNELSIHIPEGTAPGECTADVVGTCIGRQAGQDRFSVVLTVQ